MILARHRVMPVRCTISLSKLSQLGTTLIVLGGNHDSVSMLNESKDLLACLNTYVIANTTENVDEQVILLDDRNKQAGAILCAVPLFDREMYCKVLLVRPVPRRNKL